MIKQTKNMLFHVTAVIMATLIAACEGGPSEAEFVAACLKEGGNVASKMLDMQMCGERSEIDAFGGRPAGDDPGHGGQEAGGKGDFLQNE
jgi:hypothetical protein